MHGASSLTSKQAALHEKRRQHVRRKRIFFLITFVILIVGFFYAIRQPFLRFQNVTVTGDTLVDNSEVESFVTSEIRGYRFFLIPRNSVLFLNKTLLSELIINTFPRLSSVVIKGRRDLHITINEPVFESMYCSVSVDSVPFGCVLLHADGRISSVAPMYSHSPFFTFYKNIESLPSVGSHIVGTEEIARVRALRDEVLSYDIPVAGFLYGGEYDEILLDTGGSFADFPRIRILFGVKNTNISKTLGIAVKNEKIKKILLDDLANLDYVDLRFNEQVVYKKKTDTVVE